MRSRWPALCQSMARNQGPASRQSTMHSRRPARSSHAAPDHWPALMRRCGRAAAFFAALLLLVAVLGVAGGCGCATIDSKAPGKAEVLAHVNELCGERYELVSVETLEERPEKIEYTFRSRERELEFTATSYLSQMYFDATPLNYYSREISCDYTEAVRALYRDEVQKALAECELYDGSSDSGGSTLRVSEFDELSEAASVLARLHELYEQELDYNPPSFLEEYPLARIALYRAPEQVRLGVYKVDGSESFDAIYEELAGDYAQSYVDGKFFEGGDIPGKYLENRHVSDLTAIYLNGGEMLYDTERSPYSNYGLTTSDYKRCWYSETEQSYMLVSDVGMVFDSSSVPLIIAEYVQALGGTYTTEEKKDGSFVSSWQIGSDIWEMRSMYDSRKDVVTYLKVEKNGKALDIPFITVDQDRNVGATFCVGLRVEDFAKLFGLTYTIDEGQRAIYMESGLNE